jgi:carboxyl-terminal processing protease
MSRVGVVAVLLATAVGRLPAQQPAAYEELQAFSGVLNFVRLNYPDTIPYSKLVHAAIDGVLHALDPHSAFYSRLEFERRNALDRGELAVTGLALEEVDSAITVLAVATRGPAGKAGVQPGDRLLSVNDTSVAGLTVRNVELRLAGEQGSKVRLLFERGSRLEPDTFGVTVKRDFIPFHSVSIVRMVDSITGYVRLEEFGADAAKEVHDALGRLSGRHMRRAILDLRGNPGGYVVSAVDLASEFFSRGTVVFLTRGRKRDVDTTYITRRDGAYAGLPLIIMIDENSASASEALAASLQDHDRALLLGRRSFGKALMQMDFIVMPMGDDLHLTVGYVLSPSGRFIQRRYRGLAVEQYLAFAGKSGAETDTLRTFHTDAGRLVRGGGGIAPDIALPKPVSLPVWWSVAADSGFDDAVSDSVALTLPATPAAREAWLTASDQWRSTLLEPFLARVRSRLKIAAHTDSALDARLTIMLATRVAAVRWGSDAGEAFAISSSAAIRTAVSYFARLPELLARRTQ